eukprot:TRINITY_DN3024_c0_g1_i1.p1 TRINITY_DN3024_c0_g1~~TRINITY_DN3024_c0_g1_i1.p1  ORF type:complete len:1037 (-),score=207.38 TRINITY_DN3024_c0_g1_i1:7357-10467(-)
MLTIIQYSSINKIWTERKQTQREFQSHPRLPPCLGKLKRGVQQLLYPRTIQQLKLVNDSKELARQATEKLNEDQARSQKLLRDKENAWAAKVNSLEIELKAVKSTNMPMQGDKDRYYNALRTQLVEEIERLERTHKQREDEMLIENNNLQAEIESLQHAVNDAKKRECDLEFSFKKQLEAALAERDNIINLLQEELREEKARADNYLYKLNDCKEELRSAEEKSKEFNKEKLQELIRIQQEEIEGEKKRLSIQLKLSEELAKEKIAERNEALKTVEFQMNEELKMIDQKYRTALTEKRALESQLKSLLETTQVREERLRSECEKLEETLKALLGEGQVKESHVRVLVAELAKELLELQQSFDKREADLVADSKKIMDERKFVEAAIEKAYAEVNKLVVPEEFANIYEAQRKELELVLKEVANKSKELDELREKEAAGFKGSRKVLSATLDNLQMFMRRSKQTEDKLKSDLKALVMSVKKADESHTAEEEAAATQVATLNDELKKLRIELRTREAQQYEEKITALETELVRTQQELEASKKILLAHIDTINTLEDRIKLKEEAENFDKDDEMVRIKMENLRLNSENAALLSGKQKMETHYTDQIQKLNARYLKKAEDYDGILTKFNNLTETMANKKLEELRAWKKRSENLRKTLATLEEKLTDLAGKNTELLRFQEQHKELYAEEHKKLKEEVENAGKLWAGKQQEWDKTRKLMEDQIVVLWEKSKMAETAFREMCSLLQEKEKVVQGSIGHLEMVEKTYLATVESLKRGTNMITDWINKEEEIVKKADQGIMQKLNKRLQEVQDSMKDLKEEQSKEISTITSSYLSKIAILKEKEENALLEVESLRSQLGFCKTGFEKLQKIYETDVKVKKGREELMHEIAPAVKDEPITERVSAADKSHSKSHRSAAKKDPIMQSGKKPTQRSNAPSAAKSARGKKQQSYSSNSHNNLFNIMHCCIGKLIMNVFLNNLFFESLQGLCLLRYYLILPINAHLHCHLLIFCCIQFFLQHFHFFIQQIILKLHANFLLFHFFQGFLCF